MASDGWLAGCSTVRVVSEADASSTYTLLHFPPSNSSGAPLRRNNETPGNLGHALLRTMQDNKTATLDVVTSDYLSGSALPKKLSEGATATTETETETATEPLTTTFNSPHRLDDFITLYKIQIIQKLIPGLVKPGYTEEQESTGGGGGPGPGPSTSSSTGQYPSRPDNTRPERTHPPRFPSAGQGGGNNPLEIGRSDLDPLGGAVGRLPGAGGDGMLVGPGHPLFSREREQNDPLRIPGTDGNGNRGPWGGDGYLPPLGAPPGARFDPVAPFGPGGGGAPGFGQGPQRRDWGDEMPPPVSARSTAPVSQGMQIGLWVRGACRLSPTLSTSQGFDNEMGGNVRFNPLNPGGQGGGFGGVSGLGCP